MDGLEHIVAREQEHAQRAAHIGLLHLRETIPNLIQNGFIGVERALVLIVVADIHIGAVADKTGIRQLLADDDLDQRRFADAVRADERDTVARAHAQRQIVKKMLFAERFAHLGQLKHILAGAPARLKGKTDGALIHGLFQLFHTVERLFAAFRRADGFFAVEHAVAGDDRLLALDFLLLDFIGAHAGFKALLTLRDIPGVVSVILFGRPHQDFHNARADVIQKIAVMGNHQHAALVNGQIVFKPLQGLHVEVVGRFIQQEQIRLLQQQARQTKARLFAAAERIHTLIVLRGLKPEAVEHAGNHALP